MRPIQSLANPFALLLLSTLYGSGALIVRELAIVWKKGWLSIVLMGLAYGIVEEGLGAQSFTNPLWSGLDDPSAYSRFLGVNWVWAEQIMIYHAMFSISLSILLVGLIFPSENPRRYLSNGTLSICFILIFLNVFIQEAFLFRFWSGYAFYILAIVGVLLLGILARYAPNARRIRLKPAANGWILGLLSFMFTFLFVFAIQYELYKFLNPAEDFLFTAFFAFMALFILASILKRQPNIKSRFSLAAGPILLFVLLNSFLIPASIPGNILFAALLVIAAIRIRGKTNFQASEAE